MVLDSGDLQHRRTPANKSERPALRRVNRNKIATSRRRRVRKRPSKSNGAAVVVAALLLAAIVLLLVTRSGGGNGGGTKNGSRLLRSWKPRRRSAAAADDPEAARRAAEREARYESLYRPKFDASALGYDIRDCPPHPPPGYPRAWETAEVLGSWNPNDVTTVPPARREVYQGLCVFDHETQYEAALNYRNAEKPFVMRNDPQVVAAARRWGDDPEYLHRALGDTNEFRTERSPTSLFMWYRLRGNMVNRATPAGYVKPPNDETEMTFGEWLERAMERDGRALGDKELLGKAAELRRRRLKSRKDQREPKEDDHGDDPLGHDDEEGDNGDDDEEAKRRNLYYFRINADIKAAEKQRDSASKFVYDELPFLDPRRQKESEFYIVDPAQQRGINCRFGMRGVTAANHFDMSRNMIAIFGGERRYVLASPSQCGKMALYPKGHPSVRHSSLDWSDPAEWDEHPEFKHALVNEVVLHAGDVLYLPTNWFHYIVNLSLNYQCNARSGTTYETKHFIEDCGFDFKSGPTAN